MSCICKIQYTNDKYLGDSPEGLNATRYMYIIIKMKAKIPDNMKIYRYACFRTIYAKTEVEFLQYTIYTSFQKPPSYFNSRRQSEAK